MLQEKRQRLAKEVAASESSASTAFNDDARSPSGSTATAWLPAPQPWTGKKTTVRDSEAVETAYVAPAVNKFDMPQVIALSIGL